MMTTASERFPAITLTASERTFYNGIASQILRKAVTEYSRCKGYIDPRDWGHARTRKQISMYRSLRDRADSRVSVMIGTGHIPGTLEDVMDGLYCDTTEDIRRVKTLLGYKSVDGAVLNVTGQREPSDPFRFEGIKWFAAKAPWGVTSMRDLLTFERMGTIVDKHGTEVAYHVIQSIDRSEWPANTVKGMKRNQTSSCYLYRRGQRGLVRCFLWGELYDLNPLTRRVAEYVASGIFLSVTRAVKCARAKRCSEMIASHVDRSGPVSNQCHVCSKGAALFSNSQIECAGCRMKVCKSCTLQLQIFSIDKTTGKPDERRFCKFCASKVCSWSTSSPLPSPQTPVRTERWHSAPATVNAPTPAKSPAPPRSRMMSRKISYDLLELEEVRRVTVEAAAVQARPIATRPVSCGECPQSAQYEGHSPRAFSVGDVPFARTVATRDTSLKPRLFSTDEVRAYVAAEVLSFDSNTTHSSSDVSIPGEGAESESWNEGYGALEQRRTEGLGEFDLDLDLTAETEISRPRSATLNRVHQELVFTPEQRSGGVEKERFLDDLYASQRQLCR